MTELSSHLRERQSRGSLSFSLLAVVLAGSFLAGYLLVTMHATTAGDIHMSVRPEITVGNSGTPRTDRRPSQPSKTYNAWKHSVAYQSITAARGTNERQQKKTPYGSEENVDGN